MALRAIGLEVRTEAMLYRPIGLTGRDEAGPPRPIGLNPRQKAQGLKERDLIRVSSRAASIQLRRIETKGQAGAGSVTTETICAAWKRVLLRPHRRPVPNLKRFLVAKVRNQVSLRAAGIPSIRNSVNALLVLYKKPGFDPSPGGGQPLGLARSVELRPTPLWPVLRQRRQCENDRGEREYNRA
jgi:hypothetical protein